MDSLNYLNCNNKLLPKQARYNKVFKGRKIVLYSDNWSWKGKEGYFEIGKILLAMRKLNAIPRTHNSIWEKYLPSFNLIIQCETDSIYNLEIYCDYCQKEIPMKQVFYYFDVWLGWTIQRYPISRLNLDLINYNFRFQVIIINLNDQLLII